MIKTYSYKAKARTGQVLTGSIMAENEAAVAAYIRDKGYFVTQIKVQKSASTIGAMLDKLQLVSIKDLAVFCRQFSTMVDAGLSLLACLSIMIEQTYNPKLKAALKIIYKKVQAGETLSRAMAGHAIIFPDIMINMVEAGEVGGVLDEMLSRLAIHFEQEHKLNERVKSALVYPAVVVGIALITVSFILTFVLPPFMKLFEDMQAEIPLATQVLLKISGLLTDYGLWLTAALLLCTYGVIVLARQQQYRLVLDQLLFVLPVFGLLWRKMAIARFSRTLSTLVRGGVPIITAIEVVKKSSGNLSMTRALTAAQASIREGMGLAMPLRASNVFTPMVVQMVAVGEETGELDKMLEKIADFYDSDVEDMVSRLSSMLEPVLIGIVGMIIGFIVISVMLPIFDVLTNFNQSYN
ncbi:type II secretion system F family protein [Sporomusa sphaeroides]|uniref:Type II secretion system protein F n=1 Tax=Sporomusa sphaeroides DSM 2875 TaxID=1337886 RepID=A0ABP2C2U3_9FIRM|nr:type II secretion system F family protein [Sporomusa sphaeroides]OLS58005.1 type II secretion system protein F [Sporomusa sphaeroides DSM 2875]CVK17808.1 Type II secretion system protein F [Sporomusa sphaeroides DSM 2875]